MKFKFPTIVTAIGPRTTRQHISGVGKDAVFEERSLGIFVTTKHFGTIGPFDEPPPWKVGDRISVTMEKP